MKNFFVLLLMALAIIVFLLIMSILNLWCFPVSLATNNVSSSSNVVIVDAGHGGMDGGASCKDGSVVEKDINLAIALKLKSYLAACGYEVVLTREDDDSLSDSGSTIAQQKKSDLKNRVKIADLYPNAPLLSIHLNSFPQDRSVSGVQVFYSKNNESFGELAQSTLIEVLKPAKERVCKQIPSSIYLMRNIENPAILVECGFLSNTNDTALLISDDYQKKIAFALSLCMTEYTKEGTLDSEEL